MSTILFDLYTGIGHVHATLKLARLLTEKGQRVVYTGLETVCQPAIKDEYEFEAHYPYFIESADIKKAMMKRNFFFENLGNIFSSGLYSQSKNRIEEFIRLIHKIKPDLVILDEENTLKFFIYKQLQIPVLCVQTMVDKSPGEIIPPFTSRYFPTANNAWSRGIVKILWTKKYLANKTRVILSSTAYFWQDSFSITKRIIKEPGHSFYDEFTYLSSFRSRVKKAPLLILSPVDFDFPREEKNNVFRLGPLKDFSAKETDDSTRIMALFEKIDNWKAKTENRVVLCSLGTVTNQHEKKLVSFFNKIKEVALLNPSILFILSVSEHFKIEKLHPLPDNVLVFAKVPQMSLLKYCDLMITHGGMNSITECIMNEVPMLGYPLSNDWDQPGNSARVVFHQLGLRGRINRDSPKTISRKIEQINNDYPSYLNRIQEMKTKFEQKNNSTKAVEIIESMLQNHD